MKRRKWISVVVFWGLCASVCLITWNKVETAKKELHFKSENYKPVAIQESAPSAYIALNQGTTEEMQEASFWIENRNSAGNDPFAVIWDESQIQYFNYCNRKMLGIGNTVFDFEEIGIDFSGKVLKKIINEMIGSFGERNNYTHEGQAADQSYWNELIANTDMDQIPDLVHPQFGFSVQRAMLQRLPSDDLLLQKGGSLYFDRMPNTDLLPFEPVIVLWTSADGEWSLVLRNSSGGWVRNDAFCVCENKEEWLDAQKMDNFLVVTGKEVRFPVDPYEPDFSGMALPMGTKMELLTLDQIPSVIHHRSTLGCYVVSVPARGSDGKMEYKMVPIPASEDVHIGYLKYTEANLLDQAFKREGALYGWAGENNAQDCSGFTKEVYACFGITLPRTSVAQTELQAVSNQLLRSASKEKRLEMLKDAPAGTIMYFPGHIMIYVGTLDGAPYCISSCGNYYNKTAEGFTLKEINSVVLTPMTETYCESGESWLEALTMITMVK